MLSRVDRIYKRLADHLRILTIRDFQRGEQILRTTDEHPFCTSYARWTNAKNLQPGDVLVGPDGRCGIIIATVREEHPEGIWVYNLRVEGTHTYFVREQGVDAEPVWVHNAEYAGMDQRIGQVPYNETDLSQAVVAEREALGLQSSLRNGAALEYLQDGEPQVKVLFSRYGVGHSEELLDQWLADERIGNDQVTRWYSERQPCNWDGHMCNELLANNYPGSKVTWSIPFSTPAEQSAANARLLGLLRNTFQ